MQHVYAYLSGRCWVNERSLCYLNMPIQSTQPGCAAGFKNINFLSWNCAIIWILSPLPFLPTSCVTCISAHWHPPPSRSSPWNHFLWTLSDWWRIFLFLIFCLQRIHTVGSSRSVWFKMHDETPPSWFILSIALKPATVTLLHQGTTEQILWFCFHVSLDKQEDEFSLSVTQWLISCFFSSIFFCVNELGTVRRGQEGRKKAVTSCKVMIAVGCIWLSDASAGVCPKRRWQ